MNANIPKDNSTQIRIEICQKENLKNLNIYIHFVASISTSSALNVDECEIKRLTYHKNEFLPDKYMGIGKCLKGNVSNIILLQAAVPRSNQLMKRMKRGI